MGSSGRAVKSELEKRQSGFNLENAVDVGPAAEDRGREPGGDISCQV